MLPSVHPKQSGFMLIMVLVFLQLLAWLGCYALASASEATKMSRLQWQQQLLSLQAESHLQQLEKAIDTYVPACVLPVTPQGELLSATLDPRSLPECRGGVAPYLYYFFIEDLGSDNCAYILKDDKKYTSHLFRLTLFMTESQNAMREVLQSTVRTLDNAEMSCDEVPYPVVTGRQMWRELR